MDPAPNRRADTLFEDAALGDEIEAACASHESELLSAGLGHVTSFGETHAVTRLSANTATSGMVEEQTEVLQVLTSGQPCCMRAGGRPKLPTRKRCTH